MASLLDSHIALMQAMIDKYSRHGSPFTQFTHSDQPATVLLTGATGNLGSDVLALLLQDVNVVKVYAFNRPSSEGPTHDRIAARFRSKGLDTSILHSDKLAFLEGDLRRPNLGLNAELVQELRDSVTVLIHNAWPINLSLDLSYFEPHLLGLQNLIDFLHSFHEPLRVRFLFVSSFSSCQSWSSENNAPVPEEVMKSLSNGVGLGYGESKHVAEQIVARSGLNATSLRIIQLCGRLADGAWSPAEWVPVTIKASLMMGVIPNLAGLIPFLPLDVAAQCIRDVAVCKSQLPPVLNFRHPRPFKWEIMIDAVNEVLPKRMGLGKLPVVPYQKWVDHLEDTASYTSSKRNPALKLLTAYRAQAAASDAIERDGAQDVEHFPRPIYSNSKAMQFSPTLRNLKKLSPEDATKWVNHWVGIRFLTASLPITQCQARL